MLNSQVAFLSLLFSPPGLTELLVIFGIVLLLFGSRKLADIGRGLGEGIRNFRKGVKDEERGELEASKNRSARG